MNFPVQDQFTNRHIGIQADDLDAMLNVVGTKTLDQLMDETIPKNIRSKKPLAIPTAQTEYDYLRAIRQLAQKNKLHRTYIGQGYYGTIMPSVIQRNVFENPGWYTQYTPYQAEISQGRLESLLNFQTMVSDLTGMPVANASLLDEATAAAEAMSMFYSERNKRVRQPKDFVNTILVDEGVFTQTKDVLLSRAQPLNIKIKTQSYRDFEVDKHKDDVFAILIQYPTDQGSIEDYRALATQANKHGIYVIVAADIMSLALLTPPGEWGADAVVGSTQRFGVPIGFGGPHAGYFATHESFKRALPGRIIGLSTDAAGQPALRMALQTREQHIKRERATSNICTAQALLANIAAMYAVYHGPKGIRAIAQRIHDMTQHLAQALTERGYTLTHHAFFDTLYIDVDRATKNQIKRAALRQKINFWYPRQGGIMISLDETVQENDLKDILTVFPQGKKATNKPSFKWPKRLHRTSSYLSHPIFTSYHSETEMMRYLKRLENKDFSLVHGMIPLGSCTMKLNAASEMMPVSWPEFANMHPFVPANQAKGYLEMIHELEAYLSEITGLAACTVQPNSGAQGELTGLLVIRAFHQSRKENHRNVVLIPTSAHGTNPASAVMVGMKVVAVLADEKGNIDVHDLRQKAKEHEKNLAALMVTYPSTHGVFESAIQEICTIIHKYGGKVYLDGANMNAQVGLTNPGVIGADVCHLNLHKTFAIPHGGGGPGVGPICVTKELEPFLPKHKLVRTGGKKGIHAVNAAPWGSASILLISYAYIKMLGAKGLTDCTRYAILNANYIKSRLEKHFPILYVGEQGRVAHELIIDLRPFKSICSAEDVAKRLMDYSFHAPTLSFPVAGTIMIEPTESESKAELDRFCEAMISIKAEIDDIASGTVDAENNVLSNAPHTQAMLTADDWTFSYKRSKAAYPMSRLKEGSKFWPTIRRVNQAQGDRNLICTCPPMESYMDR